MAQEETILQVRDLHTYAYTRNSVVKALDSLRSVNVATVEGLLENFPH